MTPELKAAAERLRAMRKASDEHDGGYPDTAEGRKQSQLDHAMLAEAYLAEHPADDDEPITAEWLMDVGFCANVLSLSLLIDGHGGDTCELFVTPPLEGLSFPWLFAILQGDDDHVLFTGREFETRGDVRRLCQAIGADLKDQSNAD